MALHLETIGIDGPLLLTPTRHMDRRGSFVETLNRHALSLVGIDFRIAQINESVSIRTGTIRGLHLQLPPVPQAKIVRVLSGKIRDVVVDVRPGSAQFGRWAAVELTANEERQLFVPAGFAHGFVTCAADTRVSYCVDHPYDPGAELGLRWNDPTIGIDWGLDREPVLSERDSALPLLADAIPTLSASFPSLEIARCA